MYVLEVYFTNSSHVFRFKLQDFVYLNETGVIELAKQSWLDPKKFKDVLLDKAI